jgi:hypothetical protein
MIVSAGFTILAFSRHVTTLWRNYLKKNDISFQITRQVNVISLNCEIVASSRRQVVDFWGINETYGHGFPPMAPPMCSQKTDLGLRVNCPLFSSDSNQNIIISTDFSKTPQQNVSLNILLMGGELCRTDRRIDRYDAANTRCLRMNIKSPEQQLYCHVSRIAWLIITGFGFDDWFIDTAVTITVSYNRL